MNPHTSFPLPRILFGILLFLAITIGPYWLSAALALTGFFLFAPYWEMLFAAIFFDFLYHAPLSSPVIYTVPITATLLALFLLGAIVFIGERLRLPWRKRQL